MTAQMATKMGKYDLTQTEINQLRKLAQKISDIAQLPIQSEKKALWIAHNTFKETRPLVLIDQVCWNEMSEQEKLTPICENEFFRQIEDSLLKTIYKWEHFRADMVIEPFIEIPMAITNSGYGIEMDIQKTKTDEKGDVYAQHFSRVIDDYEDIEKIKNPVISLDEKDNQERMQAAKMVFDGILPIKPTGVSPLFQMWDPLIELMGVEDTIMDMMDRPEFIHAVCERFTQMRLYELDEYERQGLLDSSLRYAHCSHTFEGKEGKVGASASECWGVGLAQILGTVSPDMYDEFEVTYAKRYFAKTGPVNYGCCDPLHNKIDVVRKIPNVRKISVSPWAKVDVAAEKMQMDYIMARKPNPANLAGITFEKEIIENEMNETINICKKTKTPLEFILKDISTVNYQPQRLFEWEKIAMKAVQAM